MFNARLDERDDRTTEEGELRRFQPEAFGVA
jgi:hypothetical protein